MKSDVQFTLEYITFCKSTHTRALDMNLLRFIDLQGVHGLGENKLLLVIKKKLISVLFLSTIYAGTSSLISYMELAQCDLPRTHLILAHFRRYYWSSFLDCAAFSPLPLILHCPRGQIPNMLFFFFYLHFKSYKHYMLQLPMNSKLYSH